jgi:hypothetical protein
VWKGEGDHLNGDVVENDLTELQKAAESTKWLVNKFLAHHDEHAVEAVDETFEADEVHRAIDVVGETYRKYFGLMHGSAVLRVTPVILHDWQAVFRQPWMTTSD